MEENEDVLKLVQIIRDYVNEPRKHYGLLQDRPKFFQLSSSMDVIEDTELAIQSYSEISTADDSRKGELYLMLYGLLQAIYVQQDAIINLSETLGIVEGIKSYEKLIQIRNIRNDSVGHPTKRGFKKGKDAVTSFHFIVRISLSKDGFELFSHNSQGEFKNRYINVVELIAEQRKFVSEILNKMIKKLQQEENTHKEKFKNEKLRDIFYDSVGYSFEKINEGIHSDDPIMNEGYCILALGSLQAIANYLSKFLDAIKIRDMSRFEYLKQEYIEIDFAVKYLRDFLETKKAKESLTVDAKLTASIFIYFLDKKLKTLMQYAEEIDNEYSNAS